MHAMDRVGRLPKSSALCHERGALTARALIRRIISITGLEKKQAIAGLLREVSGSDSVNEVSPH